ncbi:hypothetical protein C8R46DRAFT_1214531 [Mycena filopes]|nr:hypothetical protein C8R46DRAFT_1214531 [Mycena filopes]
MSRCALPFHPDPAQPPTPLTGQKLYLVMGPECDTPGAYVSWPSASAQYNKYPTATLKSYFRWHEAQSAWWAGCDRGEHNHPAAAQSPASQRPAGQRPAAHGPATPRVAGSPRPRVAGSPRPRVAPTSPRSPVPVFLISSRSPSPAAASPPAQSRQQQQQGGSSSPAQPKGKQRHTPAAARDTPRPPPGAPEGRKVYAVRALDDPTGGVVFSDYDAARSWYLQKQAAGFEPTMVTGHSLTTAVNFTERFPQQEGGEAQHRRNLVEEENRARRERVQVSLQRARERGNILESLGTACEECVDESDHFSDESDLSRSTASLASELEARWSYGGEWRYYRADGGHGKA